MAGLDKRINIACSGAQTKHVWGYAAGGTAFKGEQPQTAQLYNIAGTHDVKLIVAGIGGNDMGFGPVAEKCVKAWFHSRGYPTLDPQIGTHCSDDVRKDHESKLGTVRANVMKTIDQIRATMTQRGYSNDDYRLVVMGYPGILSQHNQFKYNEGSRRTHQCPFRTSDAEYLNETLVRKLNSEMHAATHLKDVEFLDITQAFNGHRLCEGPTTRSSGSGSPSPATAEWVRFIDLTGSFPPGKGWQGHENEAIHPNRYGQQAMGKCLQRMWAQPVGRYGCLGSANTTPSDMRLVNGRAPHLESTFVQTVKANLGQNPVTRNFGVVGNPYSPADKVIVDVEIDAPFHHLLEIQVQKPDGSWQTVLAKSASTGGGRRNHRALLTAAANPNGVWHVRIANHGQFASQNATLHKIVLTHY